MDNRCFCEWDQPTIRAPKALEQDENGNPVNEFKEKIKSISFNRVKGGGRAS